MSKNKILNVKHVCNKCKKSVYLQHPHQKLKCLWCDGEMSAVKKEPSK